jgi:hypothetical protein
MPITLSDTTISGLGVGGLPSGTVNSTSLADSAVTAAKLNITGGTVVQVVSTVYTAAWSLGGSSNTWYDLPFNLSITPQYSSSWIMIFCNLGNTWNQNGTSFRVLRNGSSLYSQNQGDAAGSRALVNWWQSIPGVNDTNHGSSNTMALYDNPGSTASQNYKIQVYGEGGSHYLNYAPSNPDNTAAYATRHASNMILMEIKF